MLKRMTHASAFVNALVVPVTPAVSAGASIAVACRLSATGKNYFSQPSPPKGANDNRGAGWSPW